MAGFNKVVTSYEEALADFKDGLTVMIGGFGLCGIPEGLIQQVYRMGNKNLTCIWCNKFIERCLQKCHPPMIQGRRLRIYYLTQVSANPPNFVLFVNKPDLMTDTYKKYLVNNLREEFPFPGCPLLFDLRGKGSTSRSERLEAEAAANADDAEEAEEVLVES